MDCEFCDMPLEDHKRMDAPGSDFDGLLIHEFTASDEIFDALVAELGD